MFNGSVVCNSVTQALFEILSHILSRPVPIVLLKSWKFCSLESQKIAKNAKIQIVATFFTDSFIQTLIKSFIILLVFLNNSLYRLRKIDLISH